MLSRIRNWRDILLRHLIDSSKSGLLAEWLYLQVATKRNEHIKTLDKAKREGQRYSMLTFLMITNMQ